MLTLATGGADNPIPGEIPRTPPVSIAQVVGQLHRMQVAELPMNKRYGLCNDEDGMERGAGMVRRRAHHVSGYLILAAW